MSSNSTVLYGKFFPSSSSLGTPCYKEAEMRGRKIPRYGTVLFGIYLISHGNNLVMKIDPKSTGEDYERLVLELSVRFNTNVPIESEVPTWDELILDSDASWLQKVELKKLYKLSLPSSSFFLRPKREEKIEDTLKRFTRQSKTKWGAKATSYVVKAEAFDVNEVQLVNDWMSNNGTIDAAFMRIKMLDLVPSQQAKSNPLISQIPERSDQTGRYAIAR